MPSAQDLPFYALEVLNGIRYDKTADVYSFGKIICYIFKVVFKEGNFYESGILKLLRETKEDKFWIDLIEGCVDQKPENRFSFELIIKKLVDYRKLTAKIV
jgi:hypothetical protein